MDDPNHPAALVHQLEATAAGCQWLLDRWTTLGALLDQGEAWGLRESLEALRLLGKALDHEDDPDYYPGRNEPPTSPKRQRGKSGEGQPLIRGRFGLVF